jgi:replicative DNA helicase
MFKEKYVVENNLPVTSIENDLLCNIKITIPHCIKLEKFSTIEIEENTLTLFAAKPGNGKTLFMFDFARECLKKNYKCIFFSLEMSKEAIKKRYKDNDLIFNSDNIILKDRNDITLTNIEMTIKYYIKSKTAFSKPDFIFIDYIQYISTDDFSLKEFARQIKRLAKKYKIRFICAAQLNANFAIEKTNDIVDAMSGSREISKTAEMIILCYKEKNIFNLEVVKNRNGENGPDTHLHFTLNKDGILEPYTDFEKDNKRITRETIIAHELGHNFVQYIICNKVSPIHITN